MKKEQLQKTVDRIFAFFVVFLFVTSGVSVDVIGQEKEYKDMSIDEKSAYINGDSDLASIPSSDIAQHMKAENFPTAVQEGRLSQEKAREVLGIMDINKQDQVFSQDKTELSDFQSQFSSFAQEKFGVNAQITLSIPGVKYNGGILTNPNGGSLDLKTMTSPEIVLVTAVGPGVTADVEYDGFVICRRGEPCDHVVGKFISLEVKTDNKGGIEGILIDGKDILKAGLVTKDSNGNYIVKTDFGDVIITPHEKGIIIDSEGNTINVKGASIHLTDIKDSNGNILLNQKTTVFTAGTFELSVADNEIRIGGDHLQTEVTHPITGIRDILSGKGMLIYEVKDGKTSISQAEVEGEGSYLDLESVGKEGVYIKGSEEAKTIFRTDLDTASQNLKENSQRKKVLRQRLDSEDENSEEYKRIQADLEKLNADNQILIEQLTAYGFLVISDGRDVLTLGKADVKSKFGTDGEVHIIGEDATSIIYSTSEGIKTNVLESFTVDAPRKFDRKTNIAEIYIDMIDSNGDTITYKGKTSQYFFSYEKEGYVMHTNVETLNMLSLGALLKAGIRIRPSYIKIDAISEKPNIPMTLRLDSETSYLLLSNTKVWDGGDLQEKAEALRELVAEKEPTARVVREAQVAKISELAGRINELDKQIKEKAEQGLGEEIQPLHKEMQDLIEQYNRLVSISILENREDLTIEAIKDPQLKEFTQSVQGVYAELSKEDKETITKLIDIAQLRNNDNFRETFREEYGREPTAEDFENYINQRFSELNYEGQSESIKKVILQEKAVKYKEQGKFTEAAAEYDKLIGIDKDYTNAYFAKIDSLKFAGDFESARDTLEDLQQRIVGREDLNAENKDLLFSTIAEINSEIATLEAIDNFRNAPTTDELKAKKLRDELAEKIKDSSNKESLLSLYERETSLARANLLRENGNYELANQLYQKYNIRDSSSYKSIGYNYEKWADSDKDNKEQLIMSANDAYNKAIIKEIEEKLGTGELKSIYELYGRLGLNYAKIGQVDKAISEIEEGKSYLDPVSDIGEYNQLDAYIARVYLQDERYDDSLAKAKEIIGRDPTNLDAQLVLSESYNRLTERYFRELNIYESLDLAKEQVRSWEEFVKNNPENENAKAYLDMSRQNLQQLQLNEERVLDNILGDTSKQWYAIRRIHDEIYGGMAREDATVYNAFYALRQGDDLALGAQKLGMTEEQFIEEANKLREALEGYDLQQVDKVYAELKEKYEMEKQQVKGILEELRDPVKFFEDPAKFAKQIADAGPRANQLSDLIQRAAEALPDEKRSQLITALREKLARADELVTETEAMVETERIKWFNKEGVQQAESLFEKSLERRSNYMNALGIVDETFLNENYNKMQKELAAAGSDLGVAEYKDKWYDFFSANDKKHRLAKQKFERANQDFQEAFSDYVWTLDTQQVSDLIKDIGEQKKDYQIYHHESGAAYKRILELESLKIDSAKKIKATKECQEEKPVLLSNSKAFLAAVNAQIVQNEKDEIGQTLQADIDKAQEKYDDFPLYYKMFPVVWRLMPRSKEYEATVLGLRNFLGERQGLSNSFQNAQEGVSFQLRTNKDLTTEQRKIMEEIAWDTFIDSTQLKITKAEDMRDEYLKVKGNFKDIKIGNFVLGNIPTDLKAVEQLLEVGTTKLYRAFTGILKGQNTKLSEDINDLKGLGDASKAIDIISERTGISEIDLIRNEEKLREIAPDQHSFEFYKKQIDTIKGSEYFNPVINGEEVRTEDILENADFFQEGLWDQLTKGSNLLAMQGYSWVLGKLVIGVRGLGDLTYKGAKTMQWDKVARQIGNVQRVSEKTSKILGSPYGVTNKFGNAVEKLTVKGLNKILGPSKVGQGIARFGGSVAGYGTSELWVEEVVLAGTGGRVLGDLGSKVGGKFGGAFGENLFDAAEFMYGGNINIVNNRLIANDINAKINPIVLADENTIANVINLENIADLQRVETSMPELLEGVTDGSIIGKSLINNKGEVVGRRYSMPSSQNDLIITTKDSDFYQENMNNIVEQSNIVDAKEGVSEHFAVSRLEHIPLLEQNTGLDRALRLGEVKKSELKDDGEVVGYRYDYTGENKKPVILTTKTKPSTQSTDKPQETSYMSSPKIVGGSAYSTGDEIVLKITVEDTALEGTNLDNLIKGLEKTNGVITETINTQDLSKGILTLQVKGEVFGAPTTKIVVHKKGVSVVEGTKLNIKDRPLLGIIKPKVTTIELKQNINPNDISEKRIDSSVVSEFSEMLKEENPITEVYQGDVVVTSTTGQNVVKQIMVRNMNTEQVANALKSKGYSNVNVWQNLVTVLSKTTNELVFLNTAEQVKEMDKVKVNQEEVNVLLTEPSIFAKEETLVSERGDIIQKVEVTADIKAMEDLVTEKLGKPILERRANQFVYQDEDKVVVVTKQGTELQEVLNQKVQTARDSIKESLRKAPTELKEKIVAEMEGKILEEALEEVSSEIEQTLQSNPQEAVSKLTQYEILSFKEVTEDDGRKVIQAETSIDNPVIEQIKQKINEIKVSVEEVETTEQVPAQKAEKKMPSTTQSVIDRVTSVLSSVNPLFSVQSSLRAVTDIIQQGKPMVGLEMPSAVVIEEYENIPLPTKIINKNYKIETLGELLDYLASDLDEVSKQMFISSIYSDKKLIEEIKKSDYLPLLVSNILVKKFDEVAKEEPFYKEKAERVYKGMQLSEEEIDKLLTSDRGIIKSRAILSKETESGRLFDISEIEETLKEEIDNKGLYNLMNTHLEHPDTSILIGASTKESIAEKFSIRSLVAEKYGIIFEVETLEKPTIASSALLMRNYWDLSADEQLEDERMFEGYIPAGKVINVKVYNNRGERVSGIEERVNTFYAQEKANLLEEAIKEQAIEQPKVIEERVNIELQTNSILNMISAVRDLKLIIKGKFTMIRQLRDILTKKAKEISERQSRIEVKNDRTKYRTVEDWDIENWKLAKLELFGKEDLSKEEQEKIMNMNEEEIITFHLLKNYDSFSRLDKKRALIAFGEIMDIATLPKLIEVADQTEDRGLRRRALKSITQTLSNNGNVNEIQKDTSMKDKLIQILQHGLEVDELAESAAIALARLGSDDAIPILTDIIRADDKYANNEGLLARLREALTGEKLLKDTWGKELAINLLTELGDGGVDEVLLENIDNTFGHVRRLAIRALGKRVGRGFVTEEQKAMLRLKLEEIIKDYPAVEEDLSEEQKTERYKKLNLIKEAAIAYKQIFDGKELEELEKGLGEKESGELNGILENERIRLEELSKKETRLKRLRADLEDFTDSVHRKEAVEGIIGDYFDEISLKDIENMILFLTPAEHIKVKIAVLKNLPLIKDAIDSLPRETLNDEGKQKLTEDIKEKLNTLIHNNEQPNKVRLDALNSLIRLNLYDNYRETLDLALDEVKAAKNYALSSQDSLIDTITYRSYILDELVNKEDEKTIQYYLDRFNTLHNDRKKMIDNLDREIAKAEKEEASITEEMDKEVQNTYGRLEGLGAEVVDAIGEISERIQDETEIEQIDNLKDEYARSEVMEQELIARIKEEFQDEETQQQEIAKIKTMQKVDDNTRTRREILWELGRIRNDYASEFLLQKLSDPNMEIVIFSLEALSNLNYIEHNEKTSQPKEDVVNALIARLNTDDYVLLENFLVTLINLGADERIAEFVNDNSHNLELSKSIIHALPHLPEFENVGQKIVNNIEGKFTDGEDLREFIYQEREKLREENRRTPEQRELNEDKFKELVEEIRKTERDKESTITALRNLVAHDNEAMEKLRRIESTREATLNELWDIVSQSEKISPNDKVYAYNWYTPTKKKIEGESEKIDQLLDTYFNSKNMDTLKVALNYLNDDDKAIRKYVSELITRTRGREEIIDALIDHLQKERDTLTRTNIIEAMIKMTERAWSVHEIREPIGLPEGIIELNNKLRSIRGMNVEDFKRTVQEVRDGYEEYLKTNKNFHAEVNDNLELTKRILLFANNDKNMQTEYNRVRHMREKLAELLKGRANSRSRLLEQLEIAKAVINLGAKGDTATNIAKNFVIDTFRYVTIEEVSDKSKPILLDMLNKGVTIDGEVKQILYTHGSLERDFNRKREHFKRAIINILGTNTFVTVKRIANLFGVTASKNREQYLKNKAEPSVRKRSEVYERVTDMETFDDIWETLGQKPKLVGIAPPPEPEEEEIAIGEEMPLFITQYGEVSSQKALHIYEQLQTLNPELQAKLEAALVINVLSQNNPQSIINTLNQVDTQTIATVLEDLKAQALTETNAETKQEIGEKIELIEENVKEIMQQQEARVERYLQDSTLQKSFATTLPARLMVKPSTETPWWAGVEEKIEEETKEETIPIEEEITEAEPIVKEKPVEEPVEKVIEELYEPITVERVIATDTGNIVQTKDGSFYFIAQNGRVYATRVALTYSDDLSSVDIDLYPDYIYEIKDQDILEDLQNIKTEPVRLSELELYKIVMLPLRKSGQYSFFGAHSTLDNENINPFDTHRNYLSRVGALNTNPQIRYIANLAEKSGLKLTATNIPIISNPAIAGMYYTKGRTRYILYHLFVDNTDMTNFAIKDGYSGDQSIPSVKNYLIDSYLKSIAIHERGHHLLTHYVSQAQQNAWIQYISDIKNNVINDQETQYFINIITNTYGDISLYELAQEMFAFKLDMAVQGQEHDLKNIIPVTARDIEFFEEFGLVASGVTLKENHLLLLETPAVEPSTTQTPQEVLVSALRSDIKAIQSQIEKADSEILSTVLINRMENLNAIETDNLEKVIEYDKADIINRVKELYPGNDVKLNDDLTVSLDGLKLFAESGLVENLRNELDKMRELEIERRIIELKKDERVDGMLRSIEEIDNTIKHDKEVVHPYPSVLSEQFRIARTVLESEREKRVLQLEKDIPIEEDNVNLLLDNFALSQKKEVINKLKTIHHINDIRAEVIYKKAVKKLIGNEISRGDIGTETKKAVQEEEFNNLNNEEKSYVVEGVVDLYGARGFEEKFTEIEKILAVEHPESVTVIDKINRKAGEDVFTRLSDNVKAKLIELYNYDSYTAIVHSLNVREYTKKLVESLAKEHPDKFTYGTSNLNKVIDAAFLHDIGKLKVDLFILNNPVRVDELVTIIRGNLKDPEKLKRINDLALLFGKQPLTTSSSDDDINALGNLREYITIDDLIDFQLNLPDWEPRKVTEQEKIGIILRLTKNGINPATTFMDHLRSHEASTKEILESLGVDKEIVDIASHNHNYKGEKAPFESEILQVADIYSALTEERSYKEGLPAIEALKILEKMAADKEVNKDVVDALDDIVTQESLIYKEVSYLLPNLPPEAIKQIMIIIEGAEDENQEKCDESSVKSIIQDISPNQDANNRILNIINYYKDNQGVCET